MYVRIYPVDTQIIAYKTHVKEMFFVRKGLVEVYNNSKDEMYPNKPIVYLPKYSYFGDWQILHGLKSNLIFKTMSVLQEVKQSSL